jgi:hypothetical protein
MVRQVIIPALPLLPPLLYRMTTDNAEDRFTTSQALSFFRFIQNSLTSKELEAMLSPLLDLSSGENVQRGLWDSLPADFVAKWTVGGLGWVRTNFDNFSICCQLTRKARLKQVNIRQDKSPVLPN